MCFEARLIPDRPFVMFATKGGTEPESATKIYLSALAVSLAIL
jgi:hypothetical protein